MSSASQFHWRYIVLAVLFVAGAGALVVRVVFLTMLDTAQGYHFLQNEGDLRSVRVVSELAPRGLIVDRNDVELAVSTPVYTLGVKPSSLLNDEPGLKAVAKALDEPAAALRHYLEQRKQRQFIYLRRNLPPDLALNILNLNADGVRAEPGFRRFYPAGEMVSQLVGYNNIDNKGIEGIEYAFDDHLQPELGKKRVLRNREGQVVRELEQIAAASPGETLGLSIDLKVQYMVYTALARAVEVSGAKNGSAVFVNRRTGEVLALANYPSFNPNNRVDLDYSQVRNRAVTDMMEPGSTVKPFSVLAALELGAVEQNALIDTSPGWMVVNGKTLKDFRDYGEIDLAKLLAKSSQVGITKIALQTDPFELRNVFERLGFGQQIGIGLSGETEGRLPYHRKWSDIERATMAFGHGLSMSALQLAQAYQILANDGLKQPLTLLPKPEYARGEQVVSKEAASAVKTMLAGTFKEGGTAQSSKLTVYQLAGKTGTAHKVDAAGGYSKNRYRALFAGFAPANDPEIVGVVVVDEPGEDRYYGGEVAAPVFAQVAQQVLPYLGVQPKQAEAYDLQAIIKAAMPAHQVAMGAVQ